MAAQTTPFASVEELQAEFGLIGLAFAWDTDEERLVQALAAKLTEAMDEVRIFHTGIEGLYVDAAGTRTPAQGRILARVEKLLAAAEILRRPQVMRLTGTHEPLMMEESGEFSDLIESYLATAKELLGNLSESVTPGTTGGAVFARPAFLASTFVVSAADRTPAERNLLTNELDNVSAWDTANG
jgi:hypothetical protein